MVLLAKEQRMEFKIDKHTLDRAIERGTTETEVREVIESGTPVPAKYGRKGKAKVFDFKQLRLGRYYDQKRVEVTYVEEEKALVTVTVYVFYGRWEE